MFDNSSHGTLLEVLDLTMTPMGGRLLKQWLLKPLLDSKEILARLDAVEAFLGNPAKTEKIRKDLAGIGDLERLLGKITLRTANPRDLVSLMTSLNPIPRMREIAASIESRLVQETASGIDALEDIARLITAAIEERPPIVVRDGGIIRDGYDKELDDLRTISRDAKEFIASLESRERKSAGIQSLKVRFNKVFGYYIEVSKSNLHLVPESYERKQTLVNAERFTTPELKEFETRVLTAEENIVEIESRIFSEILSRVESNAQRIRRTASSIALLDNLSTFSTVAARNSYSRPTVTDKDTIHIIGGRHPVIEAVQKQEKFVPNDSFLDNGENRILIITGPNMGGKSTYLRQVALITLMAQMGSFVPATSTEIGIVDRIFTRVGATDHLARGQSTFMVEMTETAHILSSATDKSLIILDEVGRGTSTFDGLSLAWALVEYIHSEKTLAAKVLFATHYHELTEVALTMDGVKNYHFAAKEWDQDIIFLRRIEPGSSDRSYGIEVARLAGIPDAVIRRAKEVLNNLESNEFDLRGNPRLARRDTEPSKEPSQIPLFYAAPHPIVREILEIETENMKPLDALLFLDKLKRKLSEETG
jgi:DNA mismatch repair protein MutS